jgi:hypothetical protein
MPSTSAAAIIAAENAGSRVSLICSLKKLQEEPTRKSILRKSSAFFSEKVLKKKSSMFTFDTVEPVPAIPKHSLDQKRILNPGIVIKQQPTDSRNPNPSSNKSAAWWRRVFTRD